MSETEKPFNVSDRRHFQPDGRPRDEASDDAAAPPRDGASVSTDADAPPAQAPGDRGSVSFSQFLLSLGAQASLLLSGAGQEGGPDLAAAAEGARSIISILEMLEDKTRGRRTPEEDRVLEDLLFELRLAYVERTRVGK